PWTASVNAPFARPGNRFWPSLAKAGVLPLRVDASTGLSQSDEQLLAERGIGITSFVSRPSARADELATEELHTGGQHLVERINVLQPRTVAVVGITAFRTAFSLPKSTLGRQDNATILGWPESVQLWALPNPTVINDHDNVSNIDLKSLAVWNAS